MRVCVDGKMRGWEDERMGRCVDAGKDYNEGRGTRQEARKTFVSRPSRLCATRARRVRIERLLLCDLCGLEGAQATGREEKAFKAFFKWGFPWIRKSSCTTDRGGPVTPDIKRGFGETPKPASLLVAGDRFELSTFGL
jgi:hypothetical protein